MAPIRHYRTVSVFGDRPRPPDRRMLNELAGLSPDKYSLVLIRVHHLHPRLIMISIAGRRRIPQKILAADERGFTRIKPQKMIDAKNHNLAVRRARLRVPVPPRRLNFFTATTLRARREEGRRKSTSRRTFSPRRRASFPVRVTAADASDGTRRPAAASGDSGSTLAWPWVRRALRPACQVLERPRNSPQLERALGFLR